MALSEFVRETLDTQPFLLFSRWQKNRVRSRNGTMEVKMRWEEGDTNCSFLPCTDWPLYLVRLAWLSGLGWLCFAFRDAILQPSDVASGLLSSNGLSMVANQSAHSDPWPLASRRDFTPLTGCFLLLRLFSVNLGEAVHKNCTRLFYLSNEHNYQ